MKRGREKGKWKEGIRKEKKKGCMPKSRGKVIDLIMSKGLGQLTMLKHAGSDCLP